MRKSKTLARIRGGMRRNLWRVMLLAMASAPALTQAADAEELQTRCVELLREGLRAHGTAFWPAMHAAEALTQAGHGNETRRELAPLLPALTDDQQRCGVARELARAGDAEKTRGLWDILQSPSDHGHVHAAESLFKVGWTADADITPMRQAFAQTTNPRLQMMAAAALAKHAGDAGALAFLRRRMTEEKDPALLFLFAWGLGQLGATEDAALIRSRLDDAPDAWTRSFLEHALARLGDADGRAAVLRNLAADDARVQTYAAETAGAAGITEAREALVRLLDHPNDLDTRLRAAQALLLLSTTPLE